MAVVPTIRSEGFFYEIVTTALGRTNVNATEHTEFYLVGLLDSYARENRMLPSEPLALMLMRPAEPAARTLTLKEVGDSSLLVTGFFPESIERSPCTPEYFQGLGRTAYRELACRMARSSSLSEVFDELAVEFTRFVGVLAAARGMVQMSDL